MSRSPDPAVAEAADMEAGTPEAFTPAPAERWAAGPAPGYGATQYARQVWALVWKDLIAERRTKETLSATLVFGLLVVLIFNFAFDLRRAEMDLIGPGILWVAFIFAGILGLNRGFALEKDRGALEGLMLAPMDRSAIYVGKLISTLIFMSVMELVIVPVYSLLNNQPIRLDLIPVIFMGTLGFVAVGTIFAAIAANTRTREVLLPILLFPILVPVVITAVGATGIVLRGGEDLGPPLTMLAAFDIVFLVVGVLVFGYVIEE